MTFGKKLETCNFEFELPEHNYNNRLEITRETVIRKSMPGQHYADGLNPQTRGNERMIEEITIKFSPGTNIGWVNVRQLPPQDNVPLSQPVCQNVFTSRVANE